MDKQAVGRQFRPLTTDYPENHCRKRPVCTRMVMFARTVFQRWTPKSSYIHCDGPVAFVAMYL
ncbi:MAG: hypothetical protein MUO64_19515 [Anaerolineales bacterium]|nr:hypothetical protein [Anaerolineales bacterium]